MKPATHSEDALKDIWRTVRAALKEDIGQGDVTASLFNTGGAGPG